MIQQVINTKSIAFTILFSAFAFFNASSQTLFNVTNSEQFYTVPAGVNLIEIEVAGGQGGNTGGLGAKMRGEFVVTPGQVLGIIVAEAGLASTDPLGSGGGGGGSFVYDDATTTLWIAAGGGGGKMIYSGVGSLPMDANSNGTANNNGNPGTGGFPAGGTAGTGGSLMSSSGVTIAGGGAGWLSDGQGAVHAGETAPTWTGGYPYCVPMSTSCGGYGGYGGGGAGGNNYNGGGGGSGYSGGAGGQNHGGGGGSYNIGTNQYNLTGFQNGNGFVLITPVIICNPTILTADNASLGNVTSNCPISPTPPTATNDCAVSVNGTPDVTFPISALGTTTVTWTYDDGTTTITQMQDVIISANTIAPVPDAASLPDVTDCASITLTPPTATDDCEGTITATTSTTFPITAVGTTIVTWVFTDNAGNYTLQAQNAIIEDLAAPVADIATLANFDACESATPPAPTATDACAGSITGTPDVAFPITTPGFTTVTWTYDDGNGNPSTQTQTISVSYADNLVTLTGATIAASPLASSYQWIDCSTGFELFGETNQTFTPLVTGEYAVIVTDGLNGCVDTSACTLVDFAGISNIDFNSFSIAPNPTTDGIFTVHYDGVLKSIEVVDLAGRTIDVQIDLQSGIVNASGLDNGNYWVKITSENNVLVKSISILH